MLSNADFIGHRQTNSLPEVHGEMQPMNRNSFTGKAKVVTDSVGRLGIECAKIFAAGDANVH